MHGDAAARREYETAAAIYDSIGDRNGAAYMRCNIGDCYYREGDAQTAIRLTRENLSVFRDLRNWDGEAFLLCNLAEFDIVSGDLIAAAQDIASAVGAARRLDSGTWLAATAFAAAGLAAHSGDLRAAAQLFGYVRSWKTERAYYEAGDLRLQTAIEELLETGMDRDERESAGVRRSEAFGNRRRRRHPGYRRKLCRGGLTPSSRLYPFVPYMWHSDFVCLLHVGKETRNSAFLSERLRIASERCYCSTSLAS